MRGNIVESILGYDKPEDEDAPVFKQNRKYRLCVEDNPDEQKYRCGNKKDLLVPDCKLSLYLEELTHGEVQEIDLEIRNMLERHGFIVR